MFRGSQYFYENLAAIHMYKTTLKLNRPLYVKIAILDLAKYYIYEFYYNNLKAKYGDRCKLSRKSPSLFGRE